MQIVNRFRVLSGVAVALTALVVACGGATTAPASSGTASTLTPAPVDTPPPAAVTETPIPLAAAGSILTAPGSSDNGETATTESESPTRATATPAPTTDSAGCLGLTGDEVEAVLRYPVTGPRVDAAAAFSGCGWEGGPGGLSVSVISVRECSPATGAEAIPGLKVVAYETEIPGTVLVCPEGGASPWRITISGNFTGADIATLKAAANGLISKASER